MPAKPRVITIEEHYQDPDVARAYAPEDARQLPAIAERLNDPFVMPLVRPSTGIPDDHGVGRLRVLSRRVRVLQDGTDQDRRLDRVGGNGDLLGGIGIADRVDVG